MKRKYIFISILCLALTIGFFACSGSGSDTSNDTSAGTAAATDNTAAADEGSNPKGIGPHQNVELTHPLDKQMIELGKSVYDIKCASCHKLSDEKLVGPGWKGVTDRRTPEWIMNFITNTSEMLQKDTAAQNMLEICLVQMPNQNLTEADARSMLEFMRNNDGKQ
ncbi:cytochrome c [Ilyomonas limi]|uniref:Cytochrome c n=1 Tax=Ilyomonas limi TaxID=2575867 RepID=A0A4U3L553_9BACT|nr:cytochrome c [Ilyomonas limi]TKK68806.1 cytochrome c [Ilyomonas limi]